MSAFLSPYEKIQENIKNQQKEILMFCMIDWIVPRQNYSITSIYEKHLILHTMNKSISVKGIKTLNFTTNR